MPKSKGAPTKHRIAKTKSAKAKKIVTAQPLKLPNILKLTQTGWLIIWRNKKPMSLIILIYGLAYLVLVLGLSSPANVSSVRGDFSSLFNGHFATFLSGVGTFTFLVGSAASSTTPAGGAYQIVIIIIASLGIIWALRQFYMGSKIRARDGYYQGLYPLAPFVLILLFMAIELIPLVAGLGLYSLLVSGGIAVTFIEKALSIILVVGLAAVSFYLLSSSIIALYIVTLPNMTPLKALRSAKGLVKGRRWSVLRKIIFLPVLLFIVSGIITLPLIILIPTAAAWAFFVIVIIGLTYIHSYLYALYRGLINEQA